MTSVNQKLKSTRIITRQCVICGDIISVQLCHDGKYTGGNYFCKLTADDGTQIEYWECDKCYNQADE